VQIANTGRLPAGLDTDGGLDPLGIGVAIMQSSLDTAHRQRVGADATNTHQRRHHRRREPGWGVPTDAVEQVHRWDAGTDRMTLSTC
jgi:hypothetical protein